MDQVTLGQISVAVAFVVAFVGGIKYIVTDMKKIIEKAFEPTNNKIDALEKKLSDEIQKSDLNATKNYLVTSIHSLKGDGLDDISKQRLFEQYEHYIKLGGNSYIKNEIERLRNEDKL